MLGMHHAGLHDLRNLGLEHALPEGVLHLDPLTVGHAEAQGVVGVDLDEGIRVHLAQVGNLLALGVEVAVRARTGGQHERELLGELGRGHGT